MKRLLFILIFHSLTFLCFAEDDPQAWLNYSSKWFFSEIKSVNQSNTDFNDLDYLEINNDQTFEYKISKKSLFAKGTWTTDGNNIILKYTLPTDTIREYLLDYSEDKLILTENNIDYVFTNKPLVFSKNKSFTNKLLRGLLGLVSLIILAFVFSRNKRNINWSLVVKGLLIQLLLAILILKVPIVQNLFEWISSVFVTVLQFSKQGALFLFG